MGENLILATMSSIPKYEVEEVLGVIYGSSKRTRGMGGRIISGLQSIGGGKGTVVVVRCYGRKQRQLPSSKKLQRAVLVVVG